jgi:hypothetical protein
MTPRQLVKKQTKELIDSEKIFIQGLVDLSKYRAGFGDPNGVLYQILDTMQRYAAAMQIKYPDGITWISVAPDSIDSPTMIDVDKATAYHMDMRPLFELSNKLSAELTSQLKIAADTAFHGKNASKSSALCSLTITGVQRSMRYPMLLGAIIDTTERKLAEHEKGAFDSLSSVKRMTEIYVNQLNALQNADLANMLLGANQVIANASKSPYLHHKPPHMKLGMKAEALLFGQVMHDLSNKISTYKSGIHVERTKVMLKSMQEIWDGARNTSASKDMLKSLFQSEINAVNKGKNIFQRLQQGKYTSMLKACLNTINTYNHALINKNVNIAQPRITAPIPPANLAEVFKGKSLVAASQKLEEIKHNYRELVSKHALSELQRKTIYDYDHSKNKTAFQQKAPPAQPRYKLFKNAEEMESVDQQLRVAIQKIDTEISGRKNILDHLNARKHPVEGIAARIHRKK